MDKQNLSLEDLLTELNQADVPLRAALIYRLSDATPEDMESVTAKWPHIAVDRRRQLMSRLAETSETNFDVDFTTFALYGLTDDDPETRANAIAALWYSEDPHVMTRLLHVLKHDDAEIVRGAAAEALGRFVLAGELGDIAESVGHEAEEALLDTLRQDDEAELVHRHALESLAYSSRDEVSQLILDAYNIGEVSAQASAIFAMGRNADERWHKYVLKALNAPEPQLRFEAARAAGELGMSSVVVKLLRMASEQDREIQEIAIWSLGEIGGTEAQNALMRLADSITDEDLLEVVEDALSSAQLSSGQLGPVLLGGDQSDLEIDDFDEIDFEDMDD